MERSVTTEGQPLQLPITSNLGSSPTLIVKRVLNKC
jgi:hypothetical protein